MAATPSSHTFTDGVATSSEANAYIRDPITFLLNRPIAQLVQTTLQSLTSGNFAAITFNTEVVDSAGGHDNVTNNSRYTAVYAGYYAVRYTVGWAASAAGQRICCLKVNGAFLNGSGVARTASSAFASVSSGGSLVFLNVGDYVEVFAYQDSGGALNTATAQEYERSSMSVVWESN